MSTLFILYGSATGNSSHIAQDLSQSLPSSHPPLYTNIQIGELNTFKRKVQPIISNSRTDDTLHPLILISSTTGNGDPPENASRFIRQIKKEKSPLFQYCGYAVLGLGDTNYDQFCQVGKVLDKKLKELGGQRAKALGMADEGTGLEDVVEPWVESVLKDLEDCCLKTKEGGDGEDEKKVEREETVGAVVVGSRPGVPAMVGSRPGIPSMVGSRPGIPSMVGSRPGVPSTVGSRPGVPSTVGSRPGVPSTVGSRPGVPSTVGSRPGVPSTVGSRPGVPAMVGTRPNVPSMTCSTPKPQNQSIPHSLNVPQSTPKPEATLPYLATILSSLSITLPSSIPSSSLPSTTTTSNPSLSLPTTRDRSQSISTASLSTTSQGCHYNHTHPYHAPIISARYLTNTPIEPVKDSLSQTSKEKKVAAFQKGFPLTKEENTKRVLELTLQLPDDFTLEYQPGDSVGLIPDNSYAPELTRLMSLLRKRLGVDDLDMEKVRVEKETITIREALRTKVDITSIVKKRVLATLAEHCRDDKEKTIMQLLASSLPTGIQFYDKFVISRKMTVIDILEFVPSCTPPIETLLGCFPPITPRYYSIASSPLEHPHSLVLALSIVDYSLPSTDLFPATRRQGLATRHLELLAAPLLAGGKGDISIPIFPKPTTEFRLPSNPATPLVLIGPGTGVCPYLGFLSHRRGARMEKRRKERLTSEGTWRGGVELTGLTNEEDGEQVLQSADAAGEIMVFFGCRYPHHDYLYEKELKQFQKEGYITDLNVAFSRLGKTKTYVQHLLTEEGSKIAKLIVEKGASVYLCGDGNNMAKDVQKCLMELLERDAAVESGEGFLEEMKKRQKFLMDIWS